MWLDQALRWLLWIDALYSTGILSKDPLENSPAFPEMFPILVSLQVLCSNGHNYWDLDDQITYSERLRNFSRLYEKRALVQFSRLPLAPTSEII